MKKLLVPLLFLAACAGTSNDGDLDQSTATATTKNPGAGALDLPALAGPSENASERVAKFVRWAGTTLPADGPKLQAALNAARNDGAAIAALADHAMDRTDHTSALVALSLLGEMKAPGAMAHLRRVVDMPLPEQGAGEDDPRADVEQLQAKAVDGLAYLGSADADAAVMRVAAGHASRVVRAEAIDAYLYNHGDTAEARAALAQVVAREDQIFIDRPRHVAGESAEAFDAKLAEYLTKHPELNAVPVPAKREENAR